MAIKINSMENIQLILLLLIILVNYTTCLNIDILKSVINKNPSGLRLFHPAFPDEIIKPLDIDEVIRLDEIKTMLRANNDPHTYINKLRSGALPWKILPAHGLIPTNNVYSEKEIQNTFESVKHHGYIVWAYGIEKPVKNCILLNHWKQQAVLIKEYEPKYGAIGQIISFQSDDNNDEEQLVWPPLALEIEIMNNNWQPIVVSDNIINGEIFSYLPPSMSTSPWELFLILLLSPTENKEEFQALFDTGLSPKKGLIAYIRLLQAIRYRSKEWNNTPANMKILETEANI